MAKYGRKLESPDKMRVRAKWYEMLGKKLWTTYHIVIASVDCGDIRFLLSLGVSPSNIIACDIDNEALRSALRYNVTLSPQARIENTVEWAQRQNFNIGSINIDLCETLLNAAPVVAAVHRSVQKYGMKCVVMCTFSRARDKTVLQAYPYLSPDSARLAYLCAMDVPVPLETEKYRSYTSNSIGSMMGAYVWKFSGNVGKRSGYTCRACKTLGEHPSKHRKICAAKQSVTLAG